MTTILKTLVLPTHKLSLAVGITSGATDYVVEATPTVGTVLTATMPARASLREPGKQYLQRALKLTRGTSYQVRVRPVVAAVPGAWYSAVTVEANPTFSRARGVRQAVHDKLVEAGLTLLGEPVFVNSSLMGEPKVAVGHLGQYGGWVAVGVVYASSDVFDSEGEAEQVLTVPIAAAVKADEEDEGQNAVDLAEAARNALADLNLDRYGVLRQGAWTSTAPAQESAKLQVVRMEMSLTQFRDPGQSC